METSAQHTGPYHCPECGGRRHWRRGVHFDHEMRCPRCGVVWEPQPEPVRDELAKLRAELDAYRASFGCLACGEDHPKNVLCPPHEVRTTGQAWFRQRMAELRGELELVRREQAAGISLSDPRCCDHGFVDKTPADWEQLTDAARLALAHVEELRDAWQRGCIREIDNLGGTRSNRNVEVETTLRQALGEP